MIRKTKNTLKRQLRKSPLALAAAARIRSPRRQLTASDVKKARRYIEQFWVNLERYNPHDRDTLIGLPNPYLVPAHDPASSFNFDELYYWDSYFMVQGMLHDPSHKQLVMGVLENLFTLMQRYKVIPNASRTYLMGRSQPPLLTSFIFDTYEAYELDRRWLAQSISFAKTEYEVVWMGTVKPHDRQVYRGLSRYYDINVLHDLAEAESGWDMTTRFNRECLNYLPVDLNAFLYKYEADFAKAAEILDQQEERVYWQKIANSRRQVMDELMWNETKGLYYDYNFQKKQRGVVSSLASYAPMWAGMVSESRAKRLVSSLINFEARGGLITTDEPSIRTGRQGRTPTQWAYPNGWAPLHFLVIQGLEKYGYSKEAKRIAQRWIQTNLQWYNKNGVFLEKYNVVQPDKEPAQGVYPSQVGFGWTNAIFERLCQEYID